MDKCSFFNNRILLVVLLLSLLFISSLAQEQKQENKEVLSKDGIQEGEKKPVQEQNKENINDKLKEAEGNEKDKELSEEMKKHVGHEQLHSILLLVILAMMLAIQLGLVYWKKVHFRSFQVVTLKGLWIVPMAISVYYGYTRFIVIWLIYSAVTGYRLKKIFFENPMEPNTPRTTYSFFFYMYTFSFWASVAGYMVIMSDIFGFSDLLGQKLGYFGSMLLFYGLYFGVVGRDLAEICAEKMATSFGFYSKKGIPTRDVTSGSICAVCNRNLPRLRDDPQAEATIQLPNCKHEFHEFCIRGWSIIGKKDVCPFCKEKVDLKSLFVNPWEKQSILWAYLLDCVRYLVVWNPIIILFLKLFIYVFDA